jgi:hypothetical protein
MHTVDRAVMEAPLDVCFNAAADVEQWPSALPHYRWVRFQRRDGFGLGRVEMAARRAFGPFASPVWWVSEMHLDETTPAVIYRHVAGVTTGMDVVWSFEKLSELRTAVSIVHSWEEGPDWPLPAAIRKWIANAVIGPIFIHHVATRTLAGIGAKAEQIHREAGALDHDRE